MKGKYNRLNLIDCAKQAILINYILECNIIIVTLRRFKVHLIVHQLLANVCDHI
jgi:hypothetical protein